MGCRYCGARKRLIGGKCIDREKCFQRSMRRAEESFGAASKIDPSRQRALYEASRKGQG